MSTSPEQREMMGPYQRLALRMANMTLGASPEARVVIPGVTYIGQSNVIMAPNDAIMAQNDVILGAEFFSEGRGMWRYTFHQNEHNAEILGYEEPKVNDPHGGGSPSQAPLIADAGGMFTWKKKLRLVHYRIGMLVELCVVMSKLIPVAFVKVFAPNRFGFGGLFVNFG